MTLNNRHRLDARLRMIPVDREQLCREVADAHPVDYASLRRTGIDLFVLGRYPEALDLLDRALELADSDERRTAVLLNLGDCHRYRGDYVAAERLYEQAADLAAASATELRSFVWQHRGKMLAELGRTEPARALLEQALRLRAGAPALAASTQAALDRLEELVIPLPPKVVALLGDSPTRSVDHEGRSGGVEFVNGAYWMKRGTEAVGEYERLVWLGEQGVRVPAVAVFEGDVLVLEDAGVASSAAHESPGVLLGQVLRRLHDIRVSDCPFDGRLDVVLAQARRRVVEGLVDADDFDDDRRGWTPEQVLERLLAERPEETELVVAHGDYTPPNVLDGGIVIDVGRLGVADRYRDLALVHRDLLDDYGPDEVAAFFAAYGLADPDPVRLEYYRLLDELF
ncbi:phosphotransferase [Nocardia transvalensis]|uniref:phosphotransferase n=1 Tax=Nocardia transvalensis TaxID=37333 RepID=UPI0018960D2B|nr:phosphotransferase [Nocardia transvalensis]MBF6329585.1 tetratricopeptide repeat protein [Nocardia transvalensis]